MLKITFRFKGTNLSYTWWHFGNVQCPNFNKVFSMRERMGCEVCGFCPCESHREEKEVPDVPICHCCNQPMERIDLSGFGCADCMAKQCGSAHTP